MRNATAICRRVMGRIDRSTMVDKRLRGDPGPSPLSPHHVAPGPSRRKPHIIDPLLLDEPKVVLRSRVAGSCFDPAASSNVVGDKSARPGDACRRSRD